MKNEYELPAVDQNELMAVEGGNIFSGLGAALKGLTDALDSAISTLKNPDTWKGVSVYYPQ
jgi:hypothetical protein